VPLDSRHHRFKPKVSFPEEWRITEERRIELIKYRQGMVMKDQQRELAGQLVDGIKQIEQGLAKQEPIRQSLPEMVQAVRGIKGKRVSVRR
jgi:small subunit ribosomal protein S35